MKKFLLVAVMLLGILTSAFATEVPEGRVIDLLSLAGATSLAVPGTSGSTFSYSFPIGKQTSYGLKIKPASAGVVNFKVELETGFVRPTTEGTTDATTFVVIDATTPVFTMISTGLKIFSFTPISAPYGRFKFTGLTGNAAGTNISDLKVYVPKE